MSFEGLREALRGDPQGAQPEFAEIVYRSRALRRRRLGLGTLAALTAAGLVLALTGPTRDLADPSPEPSPTVPPGPGPVARADTVTRMSFSTASSGVVITARCRGGTDCRPPYRIFATDDGAATWRPVRSPVEGTSEEPLSIEAVDRATFALSTESRFLITRDGGRTWTALADRLVTEPLAALPERSQIIVGCLAPPEGCGNLVFGRDPASGVTRPLATQPNLTDAAQQPMSSAAGRGLWVAAVGEDGVPVVAYSGDRGRSWRELDTPLPFSANGVQVLAAPGSDRVFLTNTALDSRASQVWRRDGPDGDWVPVAVPDASDLAAGQVTALPDGELLYTSGPDSVSTEDDGAGLRQVDKASVAGRDVGVVVRQVVDDVIYGLPFIGPPNVIFRSGDGARTWAVRTLPA